MRVKSILPLSDAEMRKIKLILEKSSDVDAALRDLFPGEYYRMTDDTIYFGRHSHDYVYEIIPRKRLEA